MLDYLGVSIIPPTVTRATWPLTYVCDIYAYTRGTSVYSLIRRTFVASARNPTPENFRGGRKAQHVTVAVITLYRTGFTWRSRPSSPLFLWLCLAPQSQCTSRCAMARGHRLNTSTVLSLRSFSGGIRGRAFTLSSPPPPLPPPSLRNSLASVDVKQTGPGPEFSPPPPPPHHTHLLGSGSPPVPLPG